MLEEQVIPRLLARSGAPTTIHLKRFHSYGLGESHVDALLAGVEDLVPDGSVKLGFRAHYPQLETKLTVRGADMDDVRRKLEPVQAEVRKRLGNFIMAEDDQTLEGVVLAALTERQGDAGAGRDLHQRPDRRAYRAPAGRGARAAPRHHGARPRPNCTRRSTCAASALAGELTQETTEAVARRRARSDRRDARAGGADRS